jgi:DNA transformation protein
MYNHSTSFNNGLHKEKLMNQKNDQLKNPSTYAAEDLQQRLHSLGDIHIKKMFGGHGIFESGKMFALVDSEGSVFLKVDDSNRSRFEKARSKKHARMPYYQIPSIILDSDRDLKEWAQVSIEIAHQA